jgi:hypothetical protein
MIGRFESGGILGLSTLILLFLRGPSCYLMGFANIPGFLLWKHASTQNNRRMKYLAVLLGSLGQSLSMLAIMILLSSITIFLFSHLDISPLLQFAYWIFILYLCIAPPYSTLKASLETENIFNLPYYRVSLTLTMIITVILFIILRL